MKNKARREFEPAVALRRTAPGKPREEVELRELPAFVERLVGKRVARRLPAHGCEVFRWD